MELGICVRDIGGRELAELGRFAEDHGFDELYVPDASAGGLSGADGLLTGRDAFTALAAMFAATSTIGGTVGVATLISHHLRPLALAASTLQEQSEGRFSLGVGVSHRELAAVLDVPFPDAPIGFVRNWLAQLRQLSNEGMAFGGGWPVLLGALGPQMTRLGDDRRRRAGAQLVDARACGALRRRHPARCAVWSGTEDRSLRPIDAGRGGAPGRRQLRRLGQLPPALRRPRVARPGGDRRRDDAARSPTPAQHGHGSSSTPSPAWICSASTPTG